jgi:protease IV
MKNLGRFFGYVWRGLDGVRKVLHLIVLLLMFGLLLALLSPQTPEVPTKAVLTIAPQGVLVEQLSGGPLDRALAEANGTSQTETLLRDVVGAIRSAASDNRIQALLLDLGGMTGGGLSKLEEVASAVREFRKSGKPVVAYGESYDQAQYYLAAHADELYLDPHGLVFIDGFGYYRLFLKDAIDKLGVDVNVFRAGKFKSYTDQFSRNDMSEQEREESSAWLGTLWRGYQQAVTTARGMQPQALADYVEQIVPLLRANGGDLAGVAAERGLVTELKTRRQLEQRLMSIVGEDESTHSYRDIRFEDYLVAVGPGETLRKLGAKKIAVVVASGEILDGTQPAGVIGGDSLAQLLRATQYDDDVAAVVLRIDSPGGSVFASEIVRREVEALQAAGKPVIASMSSTAASGGYYIAMGADEIWASPSTLTGSIGVFAVLPTLERSLAKLGVHSDGIGTTSLAGTFGLERSLNAQQRELLQLSVDNEYRRFIGRVAEARGKTPEVIDTVAQGRVWAGSDAKEQGLVDGLGLLQDAVDAAAKRAELGEDYRLDYRETEQSWRQVFASQIHVLATRAARAVAPEQPLSAIARLTPLQAELRRLVRFAETRQAYYYCVCTVQ